jgi:hypothetical protein
VDAGASYFLKVPDRGVPAADCHFWVRLENVSADSSHFVRINYADGFGHSADLIAGATSTTGQDGVAPGGDAAANVSKDFPALGPSWVRIHVRVVPKEAPVLEALGTSVRFTTYVTSAAATVNSFLIGTGGPHGSSDGGSVLIDDVECVFR